MTKKELSRLLHTLDIPIGEGEQYLEAKGKYPKIAYWEIAWNDEMASGDDYAEVVTYQISFVSTRPRDKKLIELKKTLNAGGLHPEILHEYVKAQDAPGTFHSYFSIDVEEELTDE